MPHLRIKSGPQQGKIYDIKSDSIKIGRESSCEIHLNENGVSREHAEIYKVGDMYFIRDLGSRNGLTINENDAKDELLRDGDIIRICSFSIVFESSSHLDEELDDDDDSFLDDDEDESEMETLTVTINPSDSMKKVAPKTGEALKKLSLMLSKLEKVDDLYEEFFDILFETMNIQEAYIFVLGTGKKLMQKAYRNKDENRRGKASRSIVLRALKEKETICTANAQDDFRFKSQDSIVLKNINSVLCTPLIAMGQEMGVIYLNNDIHEKPFHQESAEIVSTMASQLSLAIMCTESKKRELNVQTSSINLVANSVETMHPFLKGRAERISRFTYILARYLKLKLPQIEVLKTASYLHHIGYINIPQSRTISLDEIQKESSYVDHTINLLKDNESYADSLKIVRYHRYRVDGTGQPDKLPIAQWTVESQILACAVELEVRINMPLFINSSDAEFQSQGDIVKQLIDEGMEIVSKPIIRALESAHKHGDLLNN